MRVASPNPGVPAPCQLVGADHGNVLGHFDAVGGGRGEHQPLTCTRTGAQRDFVRCAEASLCQKLAEERMRYEAGVNRQVVATVTAAQRSSPLGHRAAQRCPAVPRLQRWPKPNVGRADATDALKCVGHDVALETGLRRIVDVLPIAAATSRSDIRARLDPALGSGRQHLANRATRVPPALLEQLDADVFVWERARRKDGAAVAVTSHGFAARGNPRRAQVDDGRHRAERKLTG